MKKIYNVSKQQKETNRMTVQELLDLVNDMYPSATTDAVKVKYMNMGQNALSDQFGLVITNTSLLTVADNDEYALPTGIEDISQIETFDVSNSVPDLDKLVTATAVETSKVYTLVGQLDSISRISITHSGTGMGENLSHIILVGISGGVQETENITLVENSTVYSSKYYSSIIAMQQTGASQYSEYGTISVGVKLGRYETNRYNIGYKDDKPMSAACIYQGYSALGVKSLIMYPTPSATGLLVTIRYHAKLPDLSVSALSASPAFDSQYHSLLATYACMEICGNGSSPDTIQYNKFASVFEQGLTELWKKTYQQQIIAPRRRRDNKQWHNNR